MSTLTILIGFALMLFLPCVITVLGSRATEDHSVYSDRTIDPVVRTRVARNLKPATLEAAAPEVAETAQPAALRPAAKVPEPTSKAEITDPVLPNRVQKTHQARILRNEIEALMAAATAARAQADALAANARLAAAKAEAADAEASLAEAAAVAAIQEMRRAA